jgi:Icc-related predicted phosphoesterase
VFGNHEFYGQKLQKLIKELQELADGTNIHLLENESFCLADVVFLGATLWTDFALNGNPVVSEVVAQTGMNDYRRIHMESRRWLEDQVFGLKGRKAVIVTHHAPSRESVPRAFEGDAFNPAFASDMSRFIAESEARLWIHGHIHHCCDYTVGNTRVLANPRGYPTEPREGFDPGLIVEV